MLLNCGYRRLGIMRRILAVAATSGFLLGSAVPIDAFAQGADQDLVKRGEYLVTAGDCVACHTGPSGKRLAGNYILNTPIGKIRTPNLTPDDETGLGKWTDMQIRRAFQQGIDDQNKPLHWTMPYWIFRNMNSADASAIVVLRPGRSTEAAPPIWRVR